MAEADIRTEIVANFRAAVEEVRGSVPEFDSETPIEAVGIDSLDVLEVALILERHYGIELDETVFDGVHVVREVIDVFVSCLEEG